MVHGEENVPVMPVHCAGDHVGHGLCGVVDHRHSAIGAPDVNRGVLHVRYVQGYKIYFGK